ncbi:MAG: hypothetical protein NZM11_04335 [Anaerolineales bacterium]|nr:hypothetical protein [Anaerolineales bacterium]
MHPPDTFGYLLLGYGAMFGLIFLYVLSWQLLRRNIDKDLEMMESLEEKERWKT